MSFIKSKKEDVSMSNVTVNSHLIQDALREATEMIKAGVDLEKMKRVVQEMLGMGEIQEIDLKQVQAVVHGGQIAFRCGMTVSCDIGMILDCNGNCSAIFPDKDDHNVSSENSLEGLGKEATYSYSKA